MLPSESNLYSFSFWFCFHFLVLAFHFQIEIKSILSSKYFLSFHSFFSKSLIVFSCVSHQSIMNVLGKLVSV